MKVKLKDLTIEQFNDWCKNRRASSSCNSCIFQTVPCDEMCKEFWMNNKHVYNQEFLDQELDFEDYAPLLTKEEKIYLEQVIAPFKDQVIYISKEEFCGADGIEFLTIVCRDLFSTNNINTDTNVPSFTVYTFSNWSICFPRFKAGSKYAGLKIGPKYTIEELKLFK